MNNSKSIITEVTKELIVKHFSELIAEELFEIYKLRVSVFVVEQKCPYQEIDDADRAAYHIWLKDEDGIEAYARVLPAGVIFPTASIGRVIAVKRRCGLGSKIVAAVISTAETELNADEITVEAQVYARSLYEKSGFGKPPKNFRRTGFRIYKCRESGSPTPMATKTVASKYKKCKWRKNNVQRNSQEKE